MFPINVINYLNSCVQQPISPILTPKIDMSEKESSGWQVICALQTIGQPKVENNSRQSLKLFFVVVVGQLTHLTWLRI